MKVELVFDSHHDLVDFIDESGAGHYKPLPAESISIAGEFRDAEVELARNAYYAEVQPVDN